MAKVKVEDVVKVLETIRDWTQAVYVELEDYQKEQTQASETVDPTLVATLEAVKRAIGPTGEAVTAATTASAVVDGQTDLVTVNPKNNIKTKVDAMSSRVGRAC